MEDRVFSNTEKPKPPPGRTAATPAVNGGGAKPAQPLRPVYRSQYQPMKSRRSRRSCCCTCCLWLTFVVVILVILLAVLAGVFYVIYHPRLPVFTVTALRLSTFNFTTAGQLTSRLDLNVTARNPNKKLIYIYDPATINAYAEPSDAEVAAGSLPGFLHGTKNTTKLQATLTSPAQAPDEGEAADLKKSSTLSLAVEVDTKAGVKIGGLKTKRIGIKVRCSGITLAVPKGNKTADASPDAACKVKLRLKILNWNI